MTTRRIRRFAIGTGLGLGSAVVAAAPALAEDFTVTNLDQGGPGSLVYAIAQTNASSGPDRVLFQSGLTGTISPQFPLLTYGGDLEIVGPGADQITVQGDGTHPLVIVGNPSAPTPGAFTLSGLTLTGGDSNYGGAIDATNTNVTVEGSVLDSNSANLGGAIYAGSNLYEEPGRDGSITVRDTTISGNSGALGGGLAATGSVTVSGSTFSRNKSIQGGGAIEMLGSETDSTLSIEQSTFNRNGSASSGGAIAVMSPQDGVDIDLDLSSSTISGNSAGFVGGGILGGFTNATITNSIVENNFAYYGPDIYSSNSEGPLPPGPEDCGCYDTDFQTSFSFIGDTSQALITSTVAGSNILDGGDALLNSLADNGGPTRTMAVGPDSPVVNKGSSPLLVDQRGEKRPVLYPDIPNSAAPGANGADMGAYELQYVAPQPPLPPNGPFVIIGSKPNRKQGTAIVSVKVPAAGRVDLLGFKQLKSTGRYFASKGTYRFKAVPKGKLLKRLNERGRARVLVRFRFNPDRGRTLVKGHLFPLFKGNRK